MILPLLAFVFLLLQAPVANAAESRSNIQLPRNIESYLLQKYPTDPVFRVVSGDFNGDGQADYAMVLKPEDCDPRYYCTTLLIAISSGTTAITYRIFANPDSRYCDPLDIRHPGIQKGLEEITLKTDAVGCGKEGSYVILWWDGQDIRQNWIRN